MHTIALNLKKLHEQIAKIDTQKANNCHLAHIVAVSKQKPIEAILSAIQTGQFDFGENYLQEAMPKILATQDQSLTWHFIGNIQTNKTQLIAEHFSWVHSLDSLSIAERLNTQRPTILPPLQVCIQVNIDNQPSKSGISPDEAITFAKQILALPNLKLRGLMALPQPTEDFEQQRIPFHQLRLVFEALQKEGFDIDTLSMGTSNDYRAALVEGATMLRIGTAIFGERE